MARTIQILLNGEPLTEIVLYHPICIKALNLRINRKILEFQPEKYGRITGYFHNSPTEINVITT
jgi:hypothetical protein